MERFTFKTKKGTQFYRDCTSFEEAVSWFKKAYEKGMELPDPDPPVKMCREVLIRVATIDESSKELQIETSAVNFLKLEE